MISVATPIEIPTIAMVEIRFRNLEDRLDFINLANMNNEKDIRISKSFFKVNYLEESIKSKTLAETE